MTGRLCMTRQASLSLVLLTILGCARAVSPTETGPDVTAEREVVFQWSEPRFVFTVPPRQWVEAQPAPEIILNVPTRWTRGRSSLLTPKPRCQASITRLDSSGSVTRVPAPTDLAGSLAVPTLKSACFRSSGS